MKSKEWVDAALMGVSGGAAAAAAVADPLHTLMSWGVGWMIEHVWPLNEWLDWLAGNPGDVAAQADTWDSISRAMRQNAEDLRHSVRSDMSEMDGVMIASYTQTQDDTAACMEIIADYSSAMADSLREASDIVGTVHDSVREAIADVVALIGEMLVVILGTFGLGTPWAIKEVTALTAKWTTGLAPKMKAIPRMGKMLKRQADKGNEFSAKFSKSMGRGGRGGKTRGGKTLKGGNGDVMSPDHHGLPEGYEPIRAPESYTRQPGRGGAAGSRKGKKFTPAGKDEVRMENAASHKDRLARCDNCDIIVSKPYQSKRGVTPPDHQAEVDHVVPRASGGSGDPSNGACLCRACNQRKSNKY